MMSTPQITLSAQNFDIYDGDGQDLIARTGAVSIEMLERAGGQGVILGHSETGDSLEVIKNKLLTILHKREEKPELLPYITLLVGESWEEFNGNTIENVSKIVAEKLLILKDLPKNLLQNLVIGYEPKWGSRGSGHDDTPPPEPELISSCVKEMKLHLENIFGETGKKIPIIYGGRSTPQRTEQILNDTNVSGLILGSAASTVEKTISIARAMEKTMGQRQKILHANFKAFNLLDSYQAYINELTKFDDTFTIYLSPNYTDIRLLKSLLV